ncbi:MAG: hypothetical protein CVT47_03815, partial [Thermoplasmata archaeon HGW-Thermoplasmata-2]
MSEESIEIDAGTAKKHKKKKTVGKPGNVKRTKTKAKPIKPSLKKGKKTKKRIMGMVVKPSRPPAKKGLRKALVKKLPTKKKKPAKPTPPAIISEIPWNIPVSYLLAISIAEGFTASFRATNTGTIKYLYLGMCLHAILLVLLIAHSSLSTDKRLSNLLMSLALAPVIRIISLSMPLYRFAFTGWFLILSFPLLAAPFALVYIQNLNPREIGLSFGKRPLMQIAVALAGVGFGVMEYLIMKPAPLVYDVSFASITAAVIILCIATGFAEEFIFRGIIQSNASRFMGAVPGLLLTSVLFAVLHVGNITGWNLSILDPIFVFFVGLVFG